jgi:beta-glucosidase
LSYSGFAYSNLKLSSSAFKGKLIVTVDVTNTGNFAGKEVVQLYLTAPSARLQKPNEELKSFAKTDLLQPGQKQTISFVLEPKDLSSFDTNSTSWIAEAGTYTVKIGTSSLDIKQTATFHLTKELVAEKCNKVLSPQVEMNELKK